MTEGGDPDKLGRGTVWQGELDNCVHQNHIFAVRPVSNLLDPWFLAAIVRSPYGKQYFLSRSKATSNLATINKTQLGKFLIPCPDIKIQKNVISTWRTIQATTKQINTRRSELTRIRAMLLNSLFGDSE